MWQKRITIDQLYQSNEGIKATPLCEEKLKNTAFVCFKARHSQETCKTQRLPLEDYSAYLHRVRLF